MKLVDWSGTEVEVMMAVVPVTNEVRVALGQPVLVWDSRRPTELSREYWSGAELRREGHLIDSTEAEVCARRASFL
jgi:hypothetical protein